MKLNKQTMKRIEAEVSEREASFLLDLLLESDDENIIEALNQALIVVKLVHSEELTKELKDYREELIQEAENKKRREMEERKFKITKDEQKKLYELWDLFDKNKDYWKWPDNRNWTRDNSWVEPEEIWNWKVNDIKWR